MTVSRKSLQSGLYVGLGMVFIAAIGMLTVLSERHIVSFTDLEAAFGIAAGGLSVSTVMLIGVFLVAGAFAARQLGQANLSTQALNGALAAGIVALLLAALALFAAQVQLQVGGELVFPNLTPALVDLLAFGQESLVAGLAILVVGGVALGALGGLMTRLPAGLWRTALLVVVVIVVVGLLQDQVKNIISLPDVLVLQAVISVGYGVAVWRRRDRLALRLAEPAAVGAALGVLLGLLLLLSRGEGEVLPAWMGNAPILRSLFAGRDAFGVLILLGLGGAALGAIGAALSTVSGTAHTTSITILMVLLVLGILNSAGRTTFVAALAMIAVVIAGQLLMRRTAAQANRKYQSLGSGEQRASQITIGLAGLVFALVIPQMLTGYINNVVDLVGLFVMMGLGLNIVVGYAGLLDLGYVAFFAIGAYATGVLTTPNLITCGGVHPNTLDPNLIAATCTGATTFWVAWPLAMLISGLAGVLLGIPVLRMRGDYLAIVTLGFGEIIRLIALSDTFSDYLGGAQGIVGIASPVIDLTALAPGLIGSGLPLLTSLGEALSQPIALSAPSEIYYLILVGIMLTAFISFRLSRSRLGRAWRAMREDETVAQAVGVNLVQSKLLAFAIGAAFSGIGGAIFGSYLKSIFPNSFTLLVSINVLSLIIIGGLGSIPGVFIGALMIFGLPEALREFQEYRLLMFGALLVVTMLLRPEGIIPPGTPRLEEQAEKALAAEKTLAGEGA